MSWLSCPRGPVKLTCPILPFLTFQAVQKQLYWSGCPVLTILSRLSCFSCLTSNLSCSFCPVQTDLSSQPVQPTCQSDLLDRPVQIDMCKMSHPGCPVRALSLLSCTGCPVLCILSSLTCHTNLSRLICPGCPVPLSQSTSCCRCSVPTVLSWLSCHEFPIPVDLLQLSCPCCHVLAALSSFPSPVCPILKVFSSCLVQTFLSQLSFPRCPTPGKCSWLFCPCCFVFAVMF
jgi:hypothetical protein